MTWFFYQSNNFKKGQERIYSRKIIAYNVWTLNPNSNKSARENNL